MTKLKYFFMATGLFVLGAIQPAGAVENYVIDTQKQHAFIQFKIAHLGFSWLLGRFNDFEGTFVFDAKHPEKSRVQITINVASIDTNYAKRDKHLRSEDFFDVAHHPEARFISTGYEDHGDGAGLLSGRLTLHGVTKNIAIDIQQVGTGSDPWGGYRRGFEGRVTLHLSDYKMKKAAMLGPAAEDIEMFLSIEGIRN